MDFFTVRRYQLAGKITQVKQLALTNGTISLNILNKMATIRLKRTSEYNNRLRDYKIFIDGQQVGTIANGETKDFPATVGQHIITAKIDWCSSPDISIELKENLTINMKVGGFKYGQILMPIGIGLIVLHFILSKFVEFEYTIFLVTPIFFLLFYYLTIGRKKYLTLTEINEI